MTAEHALLETRNAGYAVDGVSLLDEVNLTIRSGNICALIGPNGAGKTTLVRLLCLLVKPSTGQVLARGQDIAGQWADALRVRRRFALVTQAPTMFKTNVAENLAVGLKFRGVGRKEIRHKVDKALGFVSLKHLSRRYAPSLSSGEKQMVALARAIVLEPELLFLDEPTSNLDPENTRVWEDHVLRLKKETGTTIVMVTHSLRQARRLADEAIFVHKGRIVETGSAEDFFHDPREELTRRFLGGELV